MNWLANRAFKANTGGPGSIFIPDERGVRGLQRCRPATGGLRPAETTSSVAQLLRRPRLTWKQATRQDCSLRSNTRCASCFLFGAPKASRQAARLRFIGAPCGTAGCKSSCVLQTDERTLLTTILRRKWCTHVLGAGRITVAGRGCALGRRVKVEKRCAWRWW